MLKALRTEPRLPFVAPSFDFVTRSANFGMAIAANIPIIATTIINSMSVNPMLPDPFLIFMVSTPPFVPSINELRDDLLDTALLAYSHETHVCTDYSAPP